VTTESSVRFEHGVDPIGVEMASQRAAYLLMKHAGGKVAPGVVGPNPKWKAPQITLRHARVSKLLCGSSATIPDKDIRRTLKLLGLELVREKKVKGNVVSVWRAPPWRRELSEEVDLIEEVGRIYGYDKLPGRPTMRVFPVTPHPVFEARRTARDVLTALGYTEVCGASFFNKPQASSGLPHDWKAEPAWENGRDGYKIQNPARAYDGHLRASLIPSLLKAKDANRNAGRARVCLFEVAPVCLPGYAEPHERLALLDDGLDGSDIEDKLLRVKGALEAVAKRLGPDMPPQLSPLADITDMTSAHEVRKGDTRIGLTGMCGAAAVIEVDLRALLPAQPEAPQAIALPRFPGIARDVALVMPREKDWADIGKAAGRVAHEWRSQPEFISVFDDEKVLGAGKKCIAFRIVYRAADRTLTDDDVKGPHAEFVKNLCAALDAEVRG
jgi:phenylalanyl-tRNA synthetase beta chain